MTERESDQPLPRPYWQEDLELGQLRIGGELTPVRMQLHREREQYRQREGFFEQRRQRGFREYVAAHFYILVPDISVTVELSPAPQPDGSIGDVVGSEQVGVKQQPVGSAQAWHYQDEGITVLWECLLHEWVRKENPVEDENYQVLWSGFERHLLTRFQPERIYTPAWEPEFDDDVWGQFLTQLGYTLQPRRAFMKSVPKPRGRQRARGGR
jgi:hypothetical protein